MSKGGHDVKESELDNYPEEQIFYVTFGVQYRQEAHPQGMHPDGWAVIVALTEMEARLKANELWGRAWAFMYDDLDRATGRFNKKYHPRGILAVYRADEETEHDQS